MVYQQVLDFQLEQEGWRAMSESRRRWMPQLKYRANVSFGTFLCHWNLERLDDAHQLWWGRSSLCSVPMQMLILSANSLTDTPRNALPAAGHTLSSGKWMDEINHPRGVCPIQYRVRELFHLRDGYQPPGQKCPETIYTATKIPLNI